MTRIYTPPADVEDFQVRITKVKPGGVVELAGVDSGVILLALGEEGIKGRVIVMNGGEGESESESDEVTFGYSGFLSSGAEVKIENLSESKELVLVRAMKRNVRI